MGSEIAAKADFTGVRYAQVWEDADVLVDALDVRPDDVVLSIASAGDNALALLSRGPALSFWDAYPTEIAAGIGAAGKFERYFALFRTRVLPLVHRRKKVMRLIE